MNQAFDDLGPHFGPGIADKVNIELHDPLNYGNIVFNFSDVSLSTSGNIQINNVPAIYSGSYFITIKHRNSIETTSAAPVSFNSGHITYDFSPDATKAFGDNLCNIDGVFVIYGGDTNQDGIVDVSDMLLIEADGNEFLAGYNPTDANGDGLVDLSDMLLIEKNNNLFIFSNIP
jgi:hypothetical protein